VYEGFLLGAEHLLIASCHVFVLEVDVWLCSLG